MNCFECATTLHTTSPATGICATCGAGTCLNHASIGHAYTDSQTVGNPSRHELPGRRIFCSECARADANARPMAAVGG